MTELYLHSSVCLSGVHRAKSALNFEVVPLKCQNLSYQTVWRHTPEDMNFYIACILLGKLTLIMCSATG